MSRLVYYITEIHNASFYQNAAHFLRLSIAGILYLIGVIVFGAEFKADYIDADSVSRDSDLGVSDSRQEFSYCFGLSFGALVFEIVAGILMILDTDKWTLTREVA